jgi:hypothetical protein
MIFRGFFIVPHLLQHGTSLYTVSSERPEPTSHSGIWTCDARITRFLRLRSNDCATRAFYTIIFIKSIWKCQTYWASLTLTYGQICTPVPLYSHSASFCFLRQQILWDCFQILLWESPSKNVWSIYILMKFNRVTCIWTGSTSKRGPGKI